MGGCMNAGWVTGLKMGSRLERGNYFTMMGIECSELLDVEVIFRL
jgi:hypothetical protein